MPERLPRLLGGRGMLTCETTSLANRRMKTMKTMNLVALLFVGALVAVLPAKAASGTDGASGDSRPVSVPDMIQYVEPDPARSELLMLACSRTERQNCATVEEVCMGTCGNQGFLGSSSTEAEESKCVKKCDRQYRRCMSTAGC